MAVQLIGVDADDTLWHHESYFRLTHARFAELLAPYADAALIEPRLAEVERRNLAFYGYGAKGFTLSMLETALELTDRKLPAAVMAEIIEAGRDILTHPIETLPGVDEALTALAERGRLLLITKGDLFHQEQKLAASGLGAHFTGVEVVSEKTADTYRQVFARHGAVPEQAVMAGNSVRSDVLAPLEAGSYAALIPYPLIWAHEASETPSEHSRFVELSSLGELPDWLDRL